jgi:hypothetical protein
VGFHGQKKFAGNLGRQETVEYDGLPAVIYNTGIANMALPPNLWMQPTKETAKMIIGNSFGVGRIFLFIRKYYSITS